MDGAYERMSRIQRLVYEEGCYSRAMYGWNHPHNIEWAAARRERRERDDLRRRMADLEARLNRQRVADEQDEPEQPEWHEADRQDEQACEPLVIRRRGGLPHAK